MKIRQPAVAAAAALIIVAVAWTILQPRAERAKLSSPNPVVIARATPTAPPPTARDILDREVLLALEATQRTRLRALAATWALESAAIQAELDAALADFSRFMDGARATGPTSLQEIQRRSAAISELSAALRAHRRRHAEGAAGLLTRWQRTRLDEMSGTLAAGGQR